MKAARLLKTQSGFSLIELMIVVAIIGILASIAVPNFKKFQVKARQSEAKAQLTSLYTAEKAFYGEWTGYNGDFRNIGYQPEGKMRYNVGFAAVGNIPGQPFQPSNLGGAVNTIFNTAVAAGNNAAGFTFTRETGLAGYVNALAGTAFPCNAAGSAPTQIAFVASAVSPIATLGSDRDDHWTINQDKALCNTQAGI
jgi:type IV pilus assembly protein PilA